jgi:hypothetical protein
MCGAPAVIAGKNENAWQILQTSGCGDHALTQ